MVASVTSVPMGRDLRGGRTSGSCKAGFNLRKPTVGPIRLREPGRLSLGMRFAPIAAPLRRLRAPCECLRNELPYQFSETGMTCRPPRRTLRTAGPRLHGH